MANDFLSQVLGSVLGSSAGGQQGAPGGLGGLGGLGGPAGVGGGLDSVLGSVLRGNADSQEGAGRGDSPLGGKGALLAMLIPVAMQWVQRNGGVGALLERFNQRGYSQQAASWVSTGENEPIDPQAVGQVVGTEELSRLSQQLGLPNDQVAGGLAQVLPQVVNHLTPAGNVPPDADDILGSGLAALQQFMGQRG
ncbi:MAG TPA: YidB family protein [Ramlibacter sp.]|nr:YidB family protein [Ramlibacter sp.]